MIGRQLGIVAGLGQIDGGGERLLGLDGPLLGVESHVDDGTSSNPKLDMRQLKFSARNDPFSAPKRRPPPPCRRPPCPLPATRGTRARADRSSPPGSRCTAGGGGRTHANRRR